jgi:hypothetical protein
MRKMYLSITKQLQALSIRVFSKMLLFLLITGTVQQVWAQCAPPYTLSGVDYGPATGTWTAPPTGGPYLIHITTGGAQGGYGVYNPGNGAVMTGNFIVNAGQQLDIEAGGLGGDASYAGGGGGGSGVKVDASGAILIIAGGGGGGGQTDGGNGLITTSGPNTGTAGNGGSTGANAGGGGGLNSASVGGGGAGFGAAGGGGGGQFGSGSGGFGGGGGGYSSGAGLIASGGGGGGYSGGNGGNNTGGYGAGSINTGTDQTNTAGANAGVGYVTITCLGPAQAPTTTSLSSSNNSSFTSAPNNSVTFTATAISSGGPVTSGTITFTDGGNTISGGGSIPVSNGVATVTTAFATEGTHHILATYSGTSQYLTSSGSLTQTVNNHTSVSGNQYCNAGPISIASGGTTNPYPSEIFVSGISGNIGALSVNLNNISASDPSQMDLLLVGPGGQNFILLNGVSNNTAVSGVNLTLSDAGGGLLPGWMSNLVSGSYKPTSFAQSSAFPPPAPSGSYNSPALVGTATLNSVFGGTVPNGTWKLFAKNNNGTATTTIAGGWCLNLTVGQVHTVTTVASSGNPSVFGQSVTFTGTATTTSPGTGIPTGTVTFKDGATTLGTVTLDGTGAASYTTSSLSFGSHDITAVYGGDGNNVGSTSSLVSQVVNQASTTTSVSSGQNPSVFGQSVTFSATATTTSPGTGIPTGTVTFKDGATTLGTGPLDGTGAASYTTSSLSFGSHDITAVYGGDANNIGSTSSIVSQVVNQASTGTTLSLSSSAIFYLNNVTFTAYITPSNIASALTGVVDFTINGNDYGTVAAAPVTGDPNGRLVATLTTLVTELPASYTVQAAFTSSNTNYSGSFGTAALTINPRPAGPYTADASFYNGQVFAWTTNVNSNSATVLLAAELKDPNLPAGNIKAAKVTFYYVSESGGLSPIAGATNLPVGLVNVNDLTLGTASAIVQLNIGNLNSSSYQIAIGVSGGYTNDPFNANSQVIVTVSKPIGTGYIVGGSQLANNGNSAGLIKGAVGENTDYGFNVQYTKSGKNPQGKVSFIVRSYYKTGGTLDNVEHTYLINSNDISTFNTIVNKGAGTATFTSKANLNEQLADGSVVNIEGGDNLQLIVSQNGCDQKVAITLFRKAGGIWFANNWNNTSAVLQQVNAASTVYVAGSNTVCATSNTLSRIGQTGTSIITDGLILEPKVFPNPTGTSFSLLLGGTRTEIAEVRIFNVLGQQMDVIRAAAGSTIHFGDKYRQGIYMVEVSQGIVRQVIKVVKE